MSNSNQVDHPSYYNRPGKKETIVQMVENYGTIATVCFCMLNKFKYEDRAGFKSGDSTKEQDLKKAEWYHNWSKKNTKWYHRIVLRYLFNIKL